MNTPQILFAGALCLATTASLGADQAASAPSTRAQVKQATLEAKAAGELHPGEDVRYPVTPPTPPGKPLHLKKHRKPATSDRGVQAEPAKP